MNAVKIVYSGLFDSDLDDCYTDHLVDDWLDYEELSPVKYVSTPSFFTRLLLLTPL